MIVCVCGNVSSSDIENAKQKTLEEFKQETGACIQCCKCCDMLNYYWERCHERKND